MSYTVNISLPKQLADLAKQEVEKGRYSSLSELIRSALRELLTSETVQYRLSKKAEKRAEQAMKDHKLGRTIEISSLSELE